MRRLLPATLLLVALAGCAKNRELDETGGLKVTRSICPAVAIPTYTGDVSLFSPEQSQTRARWMWLPRSAACARPATRAVRRCTRTSRSR